MKEAVYIYGAGGHGRVVADIAKACGFKSVVFVDDGDNEYSAIDEVEQCQGLLLALGIGDNRARCKAYRRAKDLGFRIVTLIHPSAVVSSSALIEEGTVIMPGVVVNADSQIGKGVILNTGCIVEHDNVIGPFVHISPGVALAGNVTIGASTHIGIGSSVIQGVQVGEGCIVGAGSTVIDDLKNGMLCYGTPCKAIKEIN